jgi:hypothetical protein
VIEMIPDIQVRVPSLVFWFLDINSMSGIYIPTVNRCEIPDFIHLRG